MRWLAKSLIIIWILVNYPVILNMRFKSNTSDVSEANLSIGIKQDNIVDIQLNEVKLFYSITPSEMAEYQKKCTQLSVVYEHIANNLKPKLSEIHHIRSKPIRRLLLQFDCLSLIWGVLHHCTFTDNDETQ